MKTAALGLACLLLALQSAMPARGQDANATPAAAQTTATAIPAVAPRCCTNCGATGLHWTLGCFPRCGCPDDYCPNPYPRQCWLPYPPFYRCVPAGDCAHPTCAGVSNEKLTWWFIPTPKAIREAIWCQP